MGREVESYSRRDSKGNIFLSRIDPSPEVTETKTLSTTGVSSIQELVDESVKQECLLENERLGNSEVEEEEGSLILCGRVRQCTDNNQGVVNRNPLSHGYWTQLCKYKMCMDGYPISLDSEFMCYM